MRRNRLFEFEDLRWFPASIRKGGTDYLRYFLDKTGFYDVAAPLLIDQLEKSGQSQIFDLCSGGGGAIQSLHRELVRLGGSGITITLSDKYPNTEAFNHIKKESGNAISYLKEPVDATSIPTSQQGILTMFTAMHHFEPAILKKILQNAAAQNKSVSFFDGGDKNFLAVAGILFFQPVSFLLLTPFFRPFSLKRLLFTYLLPAIPLMTMWDGIVSVTRLYHPDQLLAIAREAVPDYNWSSGTLKNKIGMKVTYLQGRPQR